MIGIHHVRKGKIEDPSDALLGSTAFRDVPRAAFVMLKDPHDEDTILLVHEKYNLAKQQPTLRMRLSERPVVDGDINVGLVGRIDVLGEDERTTEDIFATSSPRNADSSRESRQRRRGKMTDAEVQDWLRKTIEAAGGEIARNEVYRLAKDADIGRDPIRRAKAMLQVQIKEDYGKYPDVGRWSLPANGSATLDGPTLLPTPFKPKPRVVQ